jgi:chromosome segregation protein
VGARREPARLALATRREAAVDAEAERDGAAARLTADADAYESVHRNIEGLEADVEAARSEVFSALNSATALRHALDHAAAARDRVAATLSKLDVEASDVRIEADRVRADHVAAEAALRRAREAIEATRIARAAREAELASTRIGHEWCARAIRAGEQELAGLEARLKSLEELEAARAGFGDAARLVLAQANGKVGQLGAVADYLEVETGYERAVEACLADLLQHVVVEHPEQAVAGFDLVRDAGAGRCGFLVTSLAPTGSAASGRIETTPSDGMVALSSVVRVRGPFAEAIRQSMGDAWIADSYERAAQAARGTGWPVVTLAGDLFHAPHLVTGGGREEARGILATKREIKELRDRLETQRAGLFRLAEEASGFEATIAHASNAIAALHAEHHRQEKAIVGHDLQLQRAVEEASRLAQKGEQLARERRQAEEERDALVRRQEEARASIVRLEDEQRVADERLTAAQRRLLETRESVEELGRLVAEARAACAVLGERAAALAAEVQRMEEAGAELEARVAALATEHDEIRHRVSELHDAIAAGETRLDAAVRAIDALRLEVQAADDAVADLRGKVDQHDACIREARRALEAIRAIVSELEVARARAESDLSHLAASCLETVQATLDEVLADVEQLERDGQATPDAHVICADEGDEAAEEVDAEADGLRVGSETAAVPPQSDLGEPGASVLAAEQHTLSAEDAIGRLRAKIDRLGPVNMMAIEQFEELETRHMFLTAQCRDLTESIAQTSQAIRRIDETTRLRFAEAFAAINRHFQEAFRTLFGGGHAGLTLIDENDPLESGIEIIAQPPGKRLQSVQLLSGGEKALTAISLMFGLFRHKPSPFCLLDEIDAPLDDANIGRFVEMLRSMQDHTQFIVITHNRKTMEIADRLYGVTMEEPGVSKLISVQLN